MNGQPAYHPGVCNIGDDETRLRRNLGWAGFAAALLFAAPVIFCGLPRGVRLFVAIPVFIAALGFIQAKMHFCAYFGLRSLVNFRDAGATPEAIWEERLRALDRRQAWRIIGYAAAVTAAVTAVLWLLP
ncbi:MAG: hypothetical protein GKC04_00525 [Methanomicrobiales archaeon]|nr:hypothetical protein [Methanomicrobiales archaeon]